MIEIARRDDRCLNYSRHIVLVSARALGLYWRGKDYPMREVKAIELMAERLYPRRRWEL